jgi:hypothetical protein
MARFLPWFTNANNEVRHGLYVWGLTAGTLSGIMLIAMTRTGSVAEQAVSSMASTLTFLVTTYLGLETLGRSQVLNRVADRIGGSVADSTVTTTTQADPSTPPVTTVVQTQTVPSGTSAPPPQATTTTIDPTTVVVNTDTVVVKAS